MYILKIFQGRDLTPPPDPYPYKHDLVQRTWLCLKIYVSTLSQQLGTNLSQQQSPDIPGPPRNQYLPITHQADQSEMGNVSVSLVFHPPHAATTLRKLI